MNKEEFKNLLKKACSMNDIHINDEQALKFYVFSEHLVEVNSHTNLTAIRDIQSIIVKHYIDSLLIMSEIPLNSRVLDIGCGPGFPSIPLSIMRDDLSFICLDSTGKKIDFLNNSTNICNLKNIKGICGRAEEGSTIGSIGKFDVVVSRAMSRTNMLLELSSQYIKNNGLLIAMKSLSAADELKESLNAMKILRFSHTNTIQSNLISFDGSIEIRNQLIFKKIANTPDNYPRPFSIISKKPL